MPEPCVPLITQRGTMVSENGSSARHDAQGPRPRSTRQCCHISSATNCFTRCLSTHGAKARAAWQRDFLRMKSHSLKERG